MATPAELGRQNILANKLVDAWECGWGTRGVMIGLLDKAIGMTIDKPERALLRRHIFGYLFAESLGQKEGSPVSSRLLTNDNWYALYAWIQPTKDQETNQWRSDNINFQREVSIFFVEAKRAAEAWRKYEAETLGQLGFL
jgi:hypothetical protein